MITVEDGTGIPDANSYASVADAMEYFHERNQCPKITEGDMISAAEFLDIIYGPLYRGCKATEEQGLLFPRTGFINSHGELVQPNTIPEELKIAQYQAAKLNSEGVQLLDNPDPDKYLNSLSQSVDGAVSQTKTWSAPTSRSQTQYIGRIISPLTDASYVNRTARA